MISGKICQRLCAERIFLRQVPKPIRETLLARAIAIGDGSGTVLPAKAKVESLNELYIPISFTEICREANRFAD